LLPEDKMPEAEVTLRLAISLFLNASNLHKNYTLNKKTLLTEARNWKNLRVVFVYLHLKLNKTHNFKKSLKPFKYSTCRISVLCC
jgi:hypothetical protein